MTEKSVYLDHAGAALPSPAQIEAAIGDLRLFLPTNPHSSHPSSRRTHDLIEQARLRVLSHFHVTADDYQVIFTSGATSALRLLADCFDFGVHPRDSPAASFSNELPLSAQTFAYLDDSHTSVVGMREIVRERCGTIACLRAEQLERSDNSYSSASERDKKSRTASLFVLTGESNFCGRKYPLQWIEKIRRRCLGDDNWFVCLDASALVSTNDLNLAEWQPDFVCLSFYKMFGYPTGVGALLVRRSSECMLRKKYFGGGTVQVALAATDFFTPKSQLSDRFEDGTLDFYGVTALSKGFDDLASFGGVKAINESTFRLAKCAFECLSKLKHGNGQPVAVIYSHAKDFGDSRTQGSIVNFNFLRHDGSFVGYVEVEKMADLYSIALRTGCFCNQGACQSYLSLSDEVVKINFERGKVCGDERDMIDGRPVGSVRISFGRQSTFADLYRFLSMVYDCFVADPEVLFSALISSWNVPELNQCITENPFPAPSAHERALRRKLPSSPILTDIWLYPVKSCAPMCVDNWMLSVTGPAFDRTWIVTSKDGIGLDQKRCARLCFVEPFVDLEAQTLLLSAPELLNSTVQVPLHSQNLLSDQQRVCSDRVSTADCGDAVAAWLESATEVVGCRLRRQTAEVERSSRRNPGDRVSLVNEAQYLMINRASVRALSDIVGIDEDELVGRFRPNFVVDGLAPFAEDECDSVEIGSLKFKVVGLCTRCQMICIDQSTGQKDTSLLTALRDSRQGRTLTFGVYLSFSCTEDATISVAVGSRVSLMK